MNDITYYMDMNGLLTEKGGNAGDSCQRCFAYSFGRFLNNDANLYQYNHFLSKLQINPGVLVRNPAPSNVWWTNPLNLSRDQTRPAVIASGAYKNSDFIKDNLWQLVKHGLFYPNVYPNLVNPGQSGYTWKIPDFASPEHISEYIRALYAAGNKWMLALYPLVLLGDCFKLLGTLISVFYTDKDPTQTDDINSIISHLQALKWLPSPLSWLARRIYAKWRPIAAYSNGITSGPESALYSYLFADPDGIQPIYYIYKPLLDKYFNK